MCSIDFNDLLFNVNMQVEMKQKEENSVPSAVPQVEDQVPEETNMRVFNID